MIFVSIFSRNYPLDGNFRRKNTHWLLGCILGPRDERTFDDFAKEEASKVRQIREMD